MLKFADLKQKLKGYFDLSHDLDDLSAAKQSIVEGVSFKGSNIIILILAIFIASLGLNTNSPAVIIGAMLISPLMGPIIGIGLGAGTYDFALIKRSARNLLAASLFSVATATIYFLISPVSEGHSELLARTSPTIYDVLIGFFGGAAGIVAIACKNKGNVIPGVAIATALMPPLCTAGYGIATWQMNYFLGASYLFIINSIFIAFATLLGVKLFRFPQASFLNPERQKKVKRIVYSVVILTLIPSIYLTAMMIRDSYFTQDAYRFIDEEMRFPNTQVFSKNVYTKGWQKYIDVTLIGDHLDTDSLSIALEQKLKETSMLRGTHLTINQGFTFNPAAAVAQGDAQVVSDAFNNFMSRLDRQRAECDSLQRVIAAQQAFDSLSYTIAPEIKVLYPSVTRLSLNRAVMCDIETRRIDTLNIAIIEYRRPAPDLARVKLYLETRTGLTDIRIINPAIPLQ